MFQTCLPNVGPGALQSRENPNERSAKDIQHLGPATDFYKRHALECSGLQIAVDLFLMNSQYSDLATICKCLFVPYTVHAKQLLQFHSNFTLLFDSLSLFVII